MRRILALLSVMALMVAALAMPAAAQPIFTGGLVNVNIEDVTVQVPVGVAANLCDINANVLAAQIANTGSATCDAAVDQEL